LGTRKLKEGLFVRTSALRLRIPGLRLIHKVETQKQAQDGWVPGAWLYREAIYQELDVVLLTAWEVRQYDVSDQSGKQRTLCASADGISPVAEVEHPPADHCAPCPMSQWTDGEGINPKTGRVFRVKPPCDEGFGLLGVIPQLGDAPFWYIAKGTGQPVIRQFLERFQTDPQVQSLYDWEVRFTSEVAPAARGARWYLPVLTPAIPQTTAVGRTERNDYYALLYEQAKDVMWAPFLSTARAVEEEQGEAKDVTPAATEGGWPSDDDIPF
jgi:hypothetical protein